MELAVVTGIPFSVWATESEAVVLTALDVLDKANERAGNGR